MHIIRQFMQDICDFVCALVLFHRSWNFMLTFLSREMFTWSWPCSVVLVCPVRVVVVTLHLTAHGRHWWRILNYYEVLIEDIIRMLLPMRGEERHSHWLSLRRMLSLLIGFWNRICSLLEFRGSAWWGFRIFHSFGGVPYFMQVFLLKNFLGQTDFV